MTITHAWIALVSASAATTALAWGHAHGLVVVALLLALAMFKSRVILSDYLALSKAPAIRRGFMTVLVLWAFIAFALAAIPSLT